MKIAVLVKEVPDTWGDRKLDPSTGLLDRGASDPVIDEICERALEVALRQKDDTDAEVVLVCMGPETAKDMLRKGLAMGADSALHVLDDGLAGSDMLATSAVLAAALQRVGADLVVVGNESTDARGPAVISVTERNPEARFANFKGIMRAKKKPIDAVTAADLGASTPGAKSVVKSVAERPARQAGTKIVDEGNAAAELAKFLVDGHLI